MKIAKKVVVCSGGFDPVHRGHLQMFENAKKLGDKLVVAVNSDEWLTRKKGRPFMPVMERAAIIENLYMVDEVITGYDDSDGSSTDALRKVKEQHPDAEVIFANGGDRKKGTTPEVEYAREKSERPKRQRYQNTHSYAPHSTKLKRRAFIAD